MLVGDRCIFLLQLLHFLTNGVFQRLRATYTWHLLWTAPMLASLGTVRAIQRSSNVVLWSGWRAGVERPWLRLVVRSLFSIYPLVFLLCDNIVR